MISAKARRSGQGFFGGALESLDDLVAEKVAPAAVDLVTRTAPDKIVPTRWLNGEGRWLYVAEMGRRGGGRDSTMKRPRSDYRDGPPLYAIFADSPQWNSSAPIDEKMERMLTDWFAFPWTSCEQCQAQLDQYAQQHGWQRDPPLPADEEEPKPTRSRSRLPGGTGGDAGPDGSLCKKCGWPANLESEIGNLKSEGEAAMATKTKQRRDRRKARRETVGAAGSPARQAGPTAAKKKRLDARWKKIYARDAKARTAARRERKAKKPGTALVPAAAARAEAIVEAALTPAERSDLKKAEAVIEKNLTGCVEMGRALTEIRDRRLFRKSHATWENYLRDRWGFGRQEAADKIGAARVAAIVSPISDRAKIPPPVEDHLKALAPVADRADVKAIYERVVKRSQKEHVPITGKLLREERRRYETPGDELEKRGPRGGSRETSGVAAAAEVSRLPPRAGIAVHTPRPGLTRQEDARFGREVAEMAEHVQRAIDAWGRVAACRAALAASLREWAEEVESP